jgi:DNA-binding transcriptional regulator YhcF (GntR family)
MQSSIQLGWSVRAAELNRHSVVPLYYQIQQRLLDQIRSGSLKAGQPVPSEQEISVRTRVSRMTARQALKSLCSLGVAYSQRGKGTFVSRFKLEKNFRQVLSFSEEMRARGSRPRSRVLTFRRIQPDSEVAEALHVTPSEPVFLLRRFVSRTPSLSASNALISRFACVRTCKRPLTRSSPSTSLSSTITVSRSTLPTKLPKPRSLPPRKPACFEFAKKLRSSDLSVLLTCTAVSRSNS